MQRSDGFVDFDAKNQIVTVCHFPMLLLLYAMFPMLLFLYAMFPTSLSRHVQCCCRYSMLPMLLYYNFRMLYVDTNVVVLVPSFCPMLSPSHVQNSAAFTPCFAQMLSHLRHILTVSCYTL